MATKTKVELATAVMRKMSLIDASENAPGSHAQYIIGEYEDLHAEMVEDNRAYWDVDAIPSAIFGPMVRLVINEVQPTFGTETSLEAQEQRRTLLMKSIIRHVRKHSSGKPAQAVYF